MSSAQTSTFKKDKNNNLNDTQCLAFIKDYKEYKKGKMLNINNPRTGKLLNNEERIKFIYEKCKKKLGIDTSSSNSSSSSSKDNEIILDTFEKVQSIVYIPFNTPTQNKDLIASLFSRPINLENAYNKLNAYLNNNRPPRGQNIYIDLKNKLGQIMETNNKFICEITLDLNQQFSPKLTSKKLEDGSMTTSSMEDMWPFLSSEELRENIMKGGYLG